MTATLKSASLAVGQKLVLETAALPGCALEIEGAADPPGTAGAVSSLGGGLSVGGGALTGEWSAGTVSSIGGGLSVSGGTLSVGSFATLPTTDPSVAGALWVDATAGYVVKVSQGA